MPFAGSFNIQGSFGTISAANFNSGAATDGQVLTADGSGGAAWENARSYKVYTALLTQTGENAPVATVLENTLGGTLVWTRISAGAYKATLIGAFPVDKCFFLPVAISVPMDGGTSIQMSRISNDEIAIETSNDDIISACIDGRWPIEIRVYP